MTVPVRIQLSRRKGWRMPENTVKVDRSTPWGNPFVVGRDGTQAECVRLHRLLLDGLVCLTSRALPVEQQMYRHHVKDHLAEIRGKNLACWCRAGTPCHADALIELAKTPVCEEVA